MNDENKIVKLKPSSFNILHSSLRADSFMHKKQSLTASIPQRLERLAGLVLAISVLVFLGVSLRTLYQFPAYDGFRWYGDETWMLLAWKNLIVHGQMVVPVALSSQLLTSQGLLLGSSWIAAVIYGVPQLLVPASADIISVGRIVSFMLGISAILFIGWIAFRMNVRASATVLTMALLATTKNFTFATHSARYDILTGLALLAFVCVISSLLPSALSIRGKRRRNTNAILFLTGSSGAILAFGVSPHLEALIPLVVLFSGWRLGAFRSVKAVIAFVSGCALTTAAFIALYAIANPSFSMAGGISGDNQFGSVMSTLPFHHLFSWSAQRHQLWAKGFYLLHEAPLFAFVLPLIFISEAALLIIKRAHSTTTFVTICLLLALLVALFVQGTLPYYPIHVLPLTALTFGLHLNEWGNPSWTAPIIAITSLALSVAIWVQFIPELENAGQIGNRIGAANSTAIHTAIEYASRNWEPGDAKPLILAQGPAIHELLRDTAIRVMSESFIFFPLPRERNQPPQTTDSVLAHAEVAYVLDYNKPMTSEYETAVRRGSPIFSRIGPMLDRSVDYFHDSTSEMDTLTLYRMNNTP
jgi:hypothetical protein